MSVEFSIIIKSVFEVNWASWIVSIIVKSDAHSDWLQKLDF
jgi:hypothetical protein